MAILDNRVLFNKIMQVSLFYNFVQKQRRGCEKINRKIIWEPEKKIGIRGMRWKK